MKTKNVKGQLYMPLLAIIILLAFTLRVYRLGYQSLWDDEAWSLLLAQKDVIGIALQAVADVHPPLHYYLLHFWMPLAGNSEFAARFPSLFFGVLFVALFSRVSKDLLGALSAPLAGFVVALAPFLVYFSQEARMYTLAAFFSLLSFLLFWRALVTGHYLYWVIYVVATALALYTHYYAVFIVLFEAIYLLFRVRSYRTRFKGWLISQIAIGILVMPWLLLVIQTIRGQKAEAGLRWGMAASRPASGLLENWRGNWATRQGIRFWDVVGQCLVSFSLGESVELSWGLALSLGFAALFLLGIFVLCRRKCQRHVGFLLILYAIIPFVLTYFSAFPVTHPHWAKYFMLSTPAYYLAIIVGLTAKGRAQPWLLVGGLAFIVLTNALSLHNAYFAPAYAKDDFRPAIKYIERFSQTSDALLANPAGAFPTFWYYYRGNLPYYSPLEGAMDEAKLEEIAATHSGLWVAVNPPNDHDPDQAIEHWLTQHAYRTLTLWTGNVTFRYYSMPVNGELVRHPLQVNFADQILLTDYDLAVQATKYGHILQATLWWQALAEMDEQYLVSLRVLDQSGHLGGRKDIPPLGNFRPTVGWAEGEEIEDHVGLFIWPGTPPGEYRVEVRLVNSSNGQPLAISNQEGDHILLGPVIIGKAHAPPPIEELQFQHPVGVDLDGLRLLGYSLTPELTRPGDTLPFVLFWQAREKIGRDYLISLQLQDEDGQAWGEHRSRPLEGAYPTDRWDEGEIVRDQRDWVIPPDVPSGRHRLLVGLIDEASGEQVAQADLGKLTVEARKRVTTAPPIRYPLAVNFDHKAELLGYDLEETNLKPGDTLHLTLYWRALAEMDKSYTVFTHLLDSDSHIRGQKDSVPGNGTLPTTSWVTGEIITDKYEIAVHSDAQPGRCVLEIGFYGADTGQRLPVVSQEGQRLDDRVLLPTGITLE